MESGWNVWVWLAGGDVASGSGWNLWVLSRLRRELMMAGSQRGETPLVKTNGFTMHEYNSQSKDGLIA